MHCSDERISSCVWHRPVVGYLQRMESKIRPHGWVKDAQRLFGGIVAYVEQCRVREGDEKVIC